MRHGGAAITSGERFILVGFVDREARPYSAAVPGWAAYNGWCKFGNAAWDRSTSIGPACQVVIKEEDAEGKGADVAA